MPEITNTTISKHMKGTQKISVKLNAMRTMFLARVLALHLDVTGTEAENLNPELVENYNSLLKKIREFDASVRDFREPTMKWLSKPLLRNQAFGVTEIIETFMQLENDQDEEMYNEVTSIFNRIISLSKKKKKINVKKYELLFHLIQKELEADEAGDKGRIEELNGNLIFDFKISL